MLKKCIAVASITIFVSQTAFGVGELGLKSAIKSPPVVFQTTEETKPSLLLVETSQRPEITLTWHSVSQGFVRYSKTLDYANDAARVPLGGNVAGFAAIGGSRVTKSAGHPMGAVVKAGFYKQDSGRPWFEDLEIDKPITVTITGVRFNQAVQAPTDTSLLHMKYAAEDLESCGLPGSARANIATGSLIENLNGKIKPGIDGRLGVLSDSGEGSAHSSIDSAGLVTVTASFPYRVLKNLQDPWASELPGTFLEPIHFHFEFEAIPEGAEPLDWEQRKRDAEAMRARIEREGAVSVPGGPAEAVEESEESESETQTET